MARSRLPVLTGTTPLGEPITLRALVRSDREDFLSLRARNVDWLTPWDPTVPPGGLPRRDITADFRGYVRSLDRGARDGTNLSWVIELRERLVGMISASSIVHGAMRSASLGYWVGREVAGRWITPTAAALVGDHLLSPKGLALHRIQVDIRPENAASLAVAVKLGLREEGMKRRLLHIDGDWRDHRSFAVTSEDLGPDGLIGRISRAQHQSRARHTE